MFISPTTRETLNGFVDSLGCVIKLMPVTPERMSTYLSSCYVHVLTPADEIYLCRRMEHIEANDSIVSEAYSKVEGKGDDDAFESVTQDQESTYVYLCLSIHFGQLKANLIWTHIGCQS